MKPQLQWTGKRLVYGRANVARAYVAAPKGGGEEELEIERKFVITPAVRARVQAAAAAAGRPPATVDFVDVYYDTPDVALGRRDMWLRRRGATVELKWPHAAAGGRAWDGVDFYNESTDAETIARVVRAVAKVPLAAAFAGADGAAAVRAAATAAVAPFARLRTVRTRYALRLPVADGGGLAVRVDLDAVEFLTVAPADGAAPPLGVYQIGEVELAASEPERRRDAAACLRAAFAYLGIDGAAPAVRGKVLEYLYRYRPRHYRALEDAGLLAAKLGPPSRGT